MPRYYLWNSGGTTVNTDGTQDIITATSDLGNPPGAMYTLGLFTGANQPVAEIILTGVMFRALLNGVPVLTFSTPFALGRPFKRQILIQGGKLVYSVNSEAHSLPYSGSTRITQAVTGIGWNTQPSAIPFAVTVSMFCHTRTFGMTCHLYNSTPDSTRRASNTNTMAPVSMNTTEKGAGYTATSAKGSALVPPPRSVMPIVPTMLPPMQPPVASPSIDNNLLLLGGIIVVGLIAMAMFMH
jgi:hypothetical protein